MNNTLSLIPLSLEAFAEGAISLDDLARALRDAAQEHEPTLPVRYLDVLERLLNQLESSALFSEENIPWPELAFGSVARCLAAYFADRRAGRFRFHEDELSPDEGY